MIVNMAKIINMVNMSNKVDCPTQLFSFVLNDKAKRAQQGNLLVCEGLL